MLRLQDMDASSAILPAYYDYELVAWVLVQISAMKQIKAKVFRSGRNDINVLPKPLPMVRRRRCKFAPEP